MPKRLTRAQRRANIGWIILSVFVIGSLAVGAVASLVIGPVQDVSTPTSQFFVTILPVLPDTPTPAGTPTPTRLAPAPPSGPAVAPTQ